MTIYLDNCCYYRPFDDQTQPAVAEETVCKLHIQRLITRGEMNLASSYVLLIECWRNPKIYIRNPVINYIRKNTSVYIGIEHREEVECRAEKIKETGIKNMDAYHVASAILSDCAYFITTDKRLLKYRSDEIRVVSPVQFIKEVEDNHYDVG